MTTTAATGEAVRLHRALSDLIRAIQFRDRDQICCHDLSVTQCYALEAILRREGLSLNDLAAELFLDKSTASRIVDGLEEKGLARREPDPDDGRALRIVATDEGRETHERIEAELVGDVERMLEGLGARERESAARTVERLAAVTAERVERGGGRCVRLP